MTKSFIQIDSAKIGAEHPPYIIAEMSGNHNGSLEKALEIVEAAARAGANAIKLQTYTADTMTLDVKNDYFKINDPESLWANQYLYDLYKIAYTPWEWHEPILNKARDLGITCFSTPFDESAVDFLEDLGMPAYKIASFENTHLPLIRKVASTGKPMIISNGLATISELDDAVNAARDGGCEDLILLKCTSSYPAPAENSNIITIPHLRDLYKCQIGLSDHTLGIGASLAAIAHGATIIEKHFTLSRDDEGVDSAFSLDVAELELLVRESRNAWLSLGAIQYGPSEDEEKSLRFRRSIFFVSDLDTGDIITEQDVRIIRPGYGLAPKYFDNIIGKRVTQDVKRGTPVDWSCLS